MLRTLMLLGIILSVLGCCSAQTEQPAASDDNRQEREVRVDSDLLNPSYKLLTVQEMGFPSARHRYLLARNSEGEHKIQTSQEFSLVVNQITSPEQALELARLLTSTQIRPFLADIYYGEVHKKADDVPEDRWFAVAAEEYDAWELHEPMVESLEGTYRVERFVATYPRTENQQLTPARLIKIQESIGTDGAYSMEIKDVIAEGEAIQKLLLFTK